MLSDYVGFLFGNAAAIRQFAALSNGLTVGALLVFSASLARSWQRRDLAAEPWRLVAPFVASTLASLAFAVGFCLCWNRSLAQWLPVWRVSLQVFWFTAPLAWAYGWPFERGSDRLRSMKRRLQTLAVVAIWRMVLAMRCLTVLFDVHAIAACCYVMLFGSAVAAIAVWGASRRALMESRQRIDALPTIVDMMGGAAPQLPRELRLSGEVAGCLFPLCVLILIASIPALIGWLPQTAAPLAVDAANERAPQLLWLFAAGSVLFWAALLPRAQQRQRNKSRVDQMLPELSFEAAYEFLRECSEDDLPPQWLLPLRRVWNQGDPSQLFDLLDRTRVLSVNDPAYWLRRQAEKLWGCYLDQPVYWWYDDDIVDGVAARLDDWPPSEELAMRIQDTLAFHEMMLDMNAAEEPDGEAGLGRDSLDEIQREENAVSDRGIVTRPPAKTPAREHVAAVLRSLSSLPS